MYGVDRGDLGLCVGVGGAGNGRFGFGVARREACQGGSGSGDVGWESDEVEYGTDGDEGTSGESDRDCGTGEGGWDSNDEK